MLVLNRKPGAKVVIDGNVILTILSCDGNRVSIGIIAPDEVRILRGELVDRQEEWGQGEPELWPATIESRAAP